MNGAPRALKLKSALLPPPSGVLSTPREQGASESRRPLQLRLMLGALTCDLREPRVIGASRRAAGALWRESGAGTWRRETNREAGSTFRSWRTQPIRGRDPIVGAGSRPGASGTGRGRGFGGDAGL